MLFFLCDQYQKSLVEIHTSIGKAGPFRQCALLGALKVSIVINSAFLPNPQILFGIGNLLPIPDPHLSMLLQLAWGQRKEHI